MCCINKNLRAADRGQGSRQGKCALLSAGFLISQAVSSDEKKQIQNKQKETNKTAPHPPSKCRMSKKLKQLDFIPCPCPLSWYQFPILVKF